MNLNYCYINENFPHFSSVGIQSFLSNIQTNFLLLGTYCQIVDNMRVKCLVYYFNLRIQIRILPPDTDILFDNFFPQSFQSVYHYVRSY